MAAGIAHIARWPVATSISSARTAAPSMAAGRASATPAVSGTPSPRKAPLLRGRQCPAAHRARAAVSRLSPSRASPTTRHGSRASIAEFDRVTGGGFVRGSVLLLGGDPGIGKSTLLIQVAAVLARGGHRAVYISGEEAVAQVRLRAERLGLADAPVELAAETSVEDIVATLSEGVTPRLVIIDSIQTMWTDAIDSAPGTVTQVRGAAQALDPIRQARGRCRHPRRSRHQGRPDRRAARGRAHGRRCSLVRGRRLAPVPHPARGQEPLRPDR